MSALTIKTRILATPEEIVVLHTTTTLYTDSFNRVCKIGYPKRRINGVELHHDTYYQERAATGLPSQLVVSARIKATEALTSVCKLKTKGQKVSCPVSTRCAIRYDARSSKIDLAGCKANILTLKGRVHVGLFIPPYHTHRLTWKVLSSDLVEDRKHRFWLHVVVETPEQTFIPSGEVIGVDLGIVRPAVTSEAQFLGQRRWREIEARSFRLRRSLQANGSKSAKRHLKRLGRRLECFRRNCDHVLSRQIVDSVAKGTIIALEDLTDIRTRITARKTQRRRLHSWSFNRLQTFLVYKAELANVGIAFVDPRYTSQKCSRCGHREKANRKSQSEFWCKKCGFMLNADLNASRNIRDNYLASDAIRTTGGPPINRPIVAEVQSQERTPNRKLTFQMSAVDFASEKTA